MFLRLGVELEQKEIMLYCKKYFRNDLSIFVVRTIITASSSLTPGKSMSGSHLIISFSRLLIVQLKLAELPFITTVKSELEQPDVNCWPCKTKKRSLSIFLKENYSNKGVSLFVFVCFGVFTPLKNCELIWRRQLYRQKTANFGLSSVFMAIKQ